MAVPASIRAVERPSNTIVEDNGRDGPNRYAVRLRAGVKYVPGGNPQPRNGKVIGHILYSKRRIKGGCYLYTFRDSHKSSAEEAVFLVNRKKNKDFSYSWYDKKSSVFGVIIFESDEDLDPKTAYICYSDRWLLELVFNRYKNGLDRTCVQGVISQSFLIISTKSFFVSPYITFLRYFGIKSRVRARHYCLSLP